MTEPSEQKTDNLVELEVEGLILKIPFVWDETCGKYVLDYPDYLKQPTYTPDGWRIMLTYEDACPHARLQPGTCQDCGSCSHYKQVDDTWIGVCHSPAMRRAGAAHTNLGEDRRHRKTTQERVAAVKRRMGEINRQKQRRTIFLAAGAVLALAATVAFIPVRAKEEL